VGASSVSQATTTARGCSDSQSRISMFAKPTIAPAGRLFARVIDFGSAW
jgi:hypothetical protein